MRRPTLFFVRTLSALTSTSEDIAIMAGDEEGNPTPASYASPPRGGNVDGGDEEGGHKPSIMQPTTTESTISSRTAATSPTSVSTSASTIRRDRVSVGSRMSRTILVRPRKCALVVLT